MPLNQSSVSEPLYAISQRQHPIYNHYNCKYREYLKSMITHVDTAVEKYISILNFYGSNSGKPRNCESIDEFSKCLNVYDTTPEFWCGESIRFQTEEDSIKNCNAVKYEFGDSLEKLPIAEHFLWTNKMYHFASDKNHHLAAIYR